MANLECGIKNVNCRGKAKAVCHHCGVPLCEKCDTFVVDNTFANYIRGKKQYPKAHHCPSCRPRSLWAMTIGALIATIRQLLRRYSFYR